MILSFNISSSLISSSAIALAISLLLTSLLTTTCSTTLSSLLYGEISKTFSFFVSLVMYSIGVSYVSYIDISFFLAVYFSGFSNAKSVFLLTRISFLIIEN